MKKLLFTLATIFVSSYAIGQTTTENYVHNTTYRTETTTGNVNDDEKQESVTYFDGLGRPIQNVGIRAGGNLLNNNLINWKDKWTLGSGSAPFFSQNGATSENQRIMGSDPYGNTSMLWKCGNDSGSNADGGWNSTYFSVDKTMGYRYTVWVKRTGSQNGTTYHGTHSVNNLSGTANTNPYFWAGDLPNLNQWYLIVGVIHPYSYGTSNSGISGVYDANGNKVLNGTDYKWMSTTTTANFRSYLYYATDTNVRQYFYDPIVQRLDGNEASIDDLIEGHIGKDIVTHFDYDAYGRQDKDYLPYAASSNGGLYRTTAFNDTGVFYDIPKYENTANFYSEKHLEASPLNRVLEQAAPGADWAVNKTSDTDHTIKFDYQTNTGTEVKIYEVNLSFANNTYTPTLTGGTSNYLAGELYKTVTKDENWKTSDGTNHTTEEFKDKQGRVILKRTYNISVAHDTYYVYDDYGNLSYVLPPKSEPQSAKPDATELSELCFQYKYDHRNRLVEKKIPGKGWEYIVYNKLDQPVLTQDSNLSAQNQWLFTQYDAFSRIAYTGIYQNSGTRSMVQSDVDNSTHQYVTRVSGSPTVSWATHSGSVLFYNSQGDAYIKPVIATELYTINYYDTYTDLPSGFTAPTTVYSQDVTAKTKGLSTVSKVRVLDTNDWITTVTYYDKKSRPIYVYSKNDYLNTIDIVESKLDFIGNAIEVKTTHKKTGKTDVITLDTFTYDHAGRLLSQKQKINSLAEELIAKNLYDKLGQLVKKDVGNREASPFQEVDYTYNIRGWLKTINDPTNLHKGTDLFSFGLNYNKPEGPSASTSYNNPLYNGNISHAYWKTDNVDGGLMHYSYKYDALNRFTNAYFAENHAYNSKFNEYIYNYDKNGNIGRILRYGQNPSNSQYSYPMDNITYTYNQGNKLMAVADSYGANTTSNAMGGFKDGNTSGNDYIYDANGNMTKDLNKGINSITYNHLNLPTNVSINGNGNVGTISYIYDATGVKLKKTVSSSTGATTEYAGNYVYENSSLKFFNHPEGYVDAVGGYKYVYQYKDHLGNVRLSYSDSDNDGEITGASTQIFYDDLDVNSSGWDSIGALYGTTASIDATHTLSGSSSIKLDKSTSTSRYAHSNTWIPINNAQTTEYIFSGWYYSNGPGARLVFFMNEDTETSYFTLVEHSGASYTTGKWVYLEKRATVPMNIDKINLRIGAFKGQTGSVWFDNLSIRKANDPNDIEILEENNYYPFGLQHKGYNNVVNGQENNFKTFQGKEEEKELGRNTYDFGWRAFDPAIARWTNIDPMAERYLKTSPYVFTANNPIYNIEVDGRYFEGKDEKRAARLQRKAEKRAAKLNKRADKLEAKGKDIGDLRDRAGELTQSSQDIQDMRANEDTQFRYASTNSKEAKSLGLGGKPATTGTDKNGNPVINENGHNVITMFTGSKTGQQLHETRHGGQHSRGEINAITQTRGLDAEVSAYRAEFAYDGVLKYMTHNFDQTNIISRALLNAQKVVPGTLRNINSMNQINTNMVLDIGEFYTDRSTRNLGTYVIPIYSAGSINNNN